MLHIVSSALGRRGPYRSGVGADSVGESLLNPRHENYDRFEEVLVSILSISLRVDELSLRLPPRARSAYQRVIRIHRIQRVQHVSVNACTCARASFLLQFYLFARITWHSLNFATTDCLDSVFLCSVLGDGSFGRRCVRRGALCGQR